MKIALAQINPTVGDFRGNCSRIIDFAQRGQQLGADLVIFPELSVCGYPPADLLEKASFLDAADDALNLLRKWTSQEGRPTLLCGTVLKTEVGSSKPIRNVAVLLSSGRVQFVQQKMLLPFYDVFDEQRYFDPAKQQQLAVLDGQPMAITICEDAWNDKSFWPRRRYSVDPVDLQMQQWTSLPQTARHASRLILNISASPYWQGKRSIRRKMLTALAKRHGATVAMVNQVGGNDSLVFDGSSMVVSPDGGVVAEGRSFEEDLLFFNTADLSAAAQGSIAEEDEIQETWAALVLGTRDYVNKCGFSKALVGLSGGIDSALVAALAVEALGAENIVGVGMPSEYSSLGSIEDARALAENLGVRFELLPIHRVFEAYRESLDPLFSGTPFGVAEENLQSRIRGGLLMALSNKFGALVLTTGNKSEMATGYCTLYGDMVGALAVIGDVTKTRVYALSRYANRSHEIIPRSILEKPPSAELRPDQKDTDSLPPYDVLDPILEAYVERFCSAEQIAEEQDVDIALVRKVQHLVEQSEYKRQQAAPVLKVTAKSFGIGRRFPIAVKYQV